ncbi:MAG: hypothetical protein V3V10_04080, partial [Planctomycetota bacterium]
MTIDNENSDAGNEEIHHEEDLDLDLSDLMNELPHEESIGDRLRAAEARAESNGVTKDTPVNVTPSGRHEIIDSDGAHDDLDLGDLNSDSGILSDADVDESTFADGSFPGPASIIEQDLDLAGIPQAEELAGGPMTMAAFDMGNAAGESENQQEDTEKPENLHDLPESEENVGSGPMTAAALKMGTDEKLTEPENVSTLTNDEEVKELSEAEENLSSAQADTLIDKGADSSETDSQTSASLPAQVEFNSALASDVAGEGPVPANEDELSLGEEGQDSLGDSEKLDLGGSGELDEPADMPVENEENAPAEEVEEPAVEEVAEEAPEEINNTDEGDAGMVSEEAASGESNVEYSQQPEVSTVGDDSGAPLGRGLDVGTANLVASRMDEEGSIEFFPARNAFLDVPEDPYTLKMLKGQGVPYIKRENKLFILGEDAFELANIFNREMRRPMKHGLISPTDVDAMPMEVELLKKILGPPAVEKEMVYYSVPADPVDSTMNIVYHTNIVNGLLDRLGYRGQPFNEGLAVIFSELAEDEFTGIGISCGGGMVNVCVAFRSMPVISFSTSKGGDWVDQQAAQVMGCATTKITAIKERGIDINAPKTPE